MSLTDPARLRQYTVAEYKEFNDFLYNGIRQRPAVTKLTTHAEWLQRTEDSIAAATSQPGTCQLNKNLKRLAAVLENDPFAFRVTNNKRVKGADGSWKGVEVAREKTGGTYFVAIGH